MNYRIRLSLYMCTALVMGLCFSGAGLVWAEEALGTSAAQEVAGQDGADESQATAKPQQAKLPEVVVRAPRPPKEGTAEDGYRIINAEFGPLGTKKILDTPYSINVVSSDVIENHQATSLKELVKYVPSAQIEARGGLDVGRPQTRGFEGTVSENNRMDGMNIAITTAYAMEQFEQVEILNGLAGTIYGPCNPSGVFNYILKRPTDNPVYKFNFTYGTKSMSTIHADLGGPFINENFGYRINIMNNNGESSTDESTLKRELGSFAFDWHILPSTVAEFNYSHFDYLMEGFAAGFSYSGSIELPDAFDPTKKGYGQEWAGQHLITDTGSVRIKHDFNQDWHLVFGVLKQAAQRKMHTVTNTFTNSEGNYRTTFGPRYSEWDVQSENLYINGRVMTGDIAHDVVIGSNGHERIGRSGLTSMRSITLGTASIDNPVSYDEPDWWSNGDHYDGNRLRQHAIILGDTITFNEHFSALLSASQNWYFSNSYSTTGDVSSKLKENGLSSTAGLMYKPIEIITTYVTYADSLQQGGVAPSTADNANEILEPYRCEQWEAGVKAELNKANVSAALFRIERPFAYTGEDNIYKEQGNQVNYGFEVMTSGRVLDDVTIYAGATFLNPKLVDTGNDATCNQQVVGVPKKQANVLVEYDTPFIKGLTASCNVHYTGRRPGNDTNTTWAAAYKVVDLGVRYARKIKGYDTLYRLNVSNVMNEEYWASIFPGSTDGTGASCSAFLGAPREVVASVQVKF